MTLFTSSKIDGMHEQLNSKGFAPIRGFRRNVTVYELVCYINNIVACYVSKNAEPIPVFIGRAKAYIASAKPNEEWQVYYEYVSHYLNEVESHLIENGISVEY